MLDFIELMLPDYLNEKHIFSDLNSEQFEALAINVFRFQANNCIPYAQYLQLLNCNVESVENISQIPFMPVEFFKDHMVVSGHFEPETVFTSSTTTGGIPSRHFIKDISIYEKSFLSTFEIFFGSPSQYSILALLPSYLERSGSSLIYMVSRLIEFGHKSSGFFLYDFEKLKQTIEEVKRKNTKILLLGVSFALLDFAEYCSVDLSEHLLIETGGMKGRKQEITREDLHQQLKKTFNISQVCSEYGMTEILSQAYAKQNGLFETPPWMRVLIRDINDPFTILDHGKTGAINIIDLVKIYSCSFLATQDLGIALPNNSFKVLGRTDVSDIRGCSLIVS